MTPKIQLALRAVSAAALVLAGSFFAVPALADGDQEPATTASAATAPPVASSAVPMAETPVTPVPGDAGLAQAVLRDLGMTLGEFNAAGEQARRAADALPSLQKLPGYVAVRLHGGRIVVEGAGIELQSRVDELNQAGPADFVLAATATLPATTPATLTAPSDSPQAPAATPETSSAAELVAASTEQLFEAFVRDVGTAGLQAVAYSDGRFIIRTGGENTAEAGRSAAAILAGGAAPPAAPTRTAPGKVSPADFVARYANVALEKGSPIATEEEVFGGQGYVTEANATCSAGFGAFNPAGQPVVLTAGHCTQDGEAKTASVEPRSSAPASGTTTPQAPPYPALGTFGFSQFGGDQSSWITGDENNPGNVGTDIAVIESLRKGLDVQPAATVWAAGNAVDPAADPGLTAVKIVGMVAPFEGQQVCRSGRTTGWSCGTVQELGIYVVGGTTADPADLRAFRGFLSKDVQSSGGDSGGPWISGNFAVGTHSAGDGGGGTENFAIATTLEDSLSRIPGGVQLQLFLNKPELVAPADQTVTAGQPVTGRVPAAPASAVAANSKVRVIIADDPAGTPVEVAVDPSGNWSFPAPPSSGPLRFSAETVNGFSRSGKASFSIEVSDLAAPVITGPAEGAALKGVDHIDGTGTPGLTVKLSGDATGTDTVSPDGRWSIAMTGKPVYGQLRVTATQTSPQQADSPLAIRNFTLAPPAPAVSTVREGGQFEQDSLPGAISGTGVDGAEVTVTIDGTPAGITTAKGGRWSLPFPAGLAPGAHGLSASQSVEGVVSDPLLATFNIDAPAEPAVPAGTVDPAAPAEPVDLADPAAPAVPVDPAAGARAVPAPAAVLPAGTRGAPGQLANTGAGSILPTAVVAAGSLLLGAALLVLGRRKRTTAAPSA
ncbi:LPXTG-motif cell wall-anchored protein [Arthrobacter sp. V4I6]|uniref:S1 family peptidase n=1 Tax=unclassified Arthrobacter TaxID=235627 RepID=UPI002781A744|nr:MULTISPECIES: S1 family peptidase [unclassified Arthrobacter]MDQ0819770.1 LPXTG-motif cell wall-anchored protein [Arthrobacter sp. V1I7]MDQ0853949.1 LPXTG-motif cell wall-anchored protein [Arthrobacter sp. V4I6]